MQKIKFRCWDKNKKQMRAVRDICFDQYGTIDVYCECDDINEPAKGNDSLMQFTGLLDRNGKEIYEGDIVSFHAFTFNGSETEYEDKGIIKYRPDGMCFVIEEKNDHDWMVRDTSNFGEACFEIIGNIYENPELLNPHTT